MAEDLKSRLDKALGQSTGKSFGGAAPALQSKAGEDDFAGDFAKLKLTVIRPTFETIGSMLKERGHEINISEEPGGKISLHIVPAGVSKSIHGYDWFPTFSFFGAPFTKTVGLHGRNMRPNSESASGSRGDYKPAQIDKALVEKELMKFIGIEAGGTAQPMTHLDGQAGKTLDERKDQLVGCRLLSGLGHDGAHGGWRGHCGQTSTARPSGELTGSAALWAPGRIRK